MWKSLLSGVKDEQCTYLQQRKLHHIQFQRLNYLALIISLNDLIIYLAITKEFKETLKNFSLKDLWICFHTCLLFSFCVKLKASRVSNVGTYFPRWHKLGLRTSHLMMFFIFCHSVGTQSFMLNPIIQPTK